MISLFANDMWGKQTKGKEDRRRKTLFKEHWWFLPICMLVFIILYFICRSSFYAKALSFRYILPTKLKNNTYCMALKKRWYLN